MTEIKLPSHAKYPLRIVILDNSVSFYDRVELKNDENLSTVLTCTNIEISKISTIKSDFVTDKSKKGKLVLSLILFIFAVTFVVLTFVLGDNLKAIMFIVSRQLYYMQ